MSLDLLLVNFTSPPVLFFLLGIGAALVRSDLNFPEQMTKALSLYLLFAIGFKGGVELGRGGMDGYVAMCLLAALFMAAVVPLAAYAVLRRLLDVPNAAAMAATYGSVSAVTFITAVEFLTQRGIEFGGHMIAAMALMESPAIVVAVLLFRVQYTGDDKEIGDAHGGFGALLRESVFNGSVVLLLGSMAIGALAGEKAVADLQPFTVDLFTGILCLFLLDMGITAAKRFATAYQAGPKLILFGIGMPLVNGAAGMLVAYAIGMDTGDAILFTVLCASASYIAVPAAMRLAIPQASPGLYITMALAVTFPFNIAVGIPLFAALNKWLLMG